MKEIINSVNSGILIIAPKTWVCFNPDYILNLHHLFHE